MPKNEQDPAGSTQQFRAFASDRESGGRRSSTGLIAGLVVVAVVVVLVVLFVVV